MNADYASPIRTAVIAASREDADELGRQLTATGLVRLVAAGCSPGGDPTPLAEILSALPELIVIDMDADRSLEALALLSSRCRTAWIWATSSRSDPDFIIQVVHSGAREFLPKPLSREGLSDALRRVATARLESSEDIHGRVYCVTAAREGCGTTTTAINLGAAIAKLPGTRVALLDFSTPLGDAATFLDLRPQFDLGDALAAGPRLDAVLLESYMTEVQGLWVLAGQRRFEENGIDGAKSLTRPLEVARKAFTHTIVDASTASHFNRLRQLSDLSDEVLVVVTPEIPALWRTYRLLTALDAPARESQLKVLLNRELKSGEISRVDVENTLRRSVDWTLPNDFRHASEAIRQGKSIVSINSSRLADQYKQLAETLTGIRPPKPKGVLGRIFGQGKDS